jgi:guanidinoacetate N-methyltransferase
MIRKLRRTNDLEITLQIKTDTFIAPPRESQRNWLLNKAMSEFVDDLTALDGLAQRFVPGIDTITIEERTNTVLSDDEIMEDWQIPLMRAMAKIAAESHGDVLEIGFGRGVSSDFIQGFGVRSHTIVECNDSVVERFDRWRERHAGKDIRMIHSRWQDATYRMGEYDSVFFHTYPLSEAEYNQTVMNSVTFAAHFFPTAAAHLREGGVFTYMTNEIDSFSRAHQRLVLSYFRSFELSLVPLELPHELRDTWWADTMVVIKAVK